MIHENYLSMLKESLPEYVRLARIGITTKKDADDDGVLGYPSATLLLAVVDIIGSHLRKRQGAEPYTVTVPGTAKPQAIKNTGDHFLALNSPYFEYAFTAEQIDKLYQLSRCPLTHTGLLGPGRISVNDPIPGGIDFRADGVHIYLPDFLRRCERAVERFLADAPKHVAESAAVADLEQKLRAAARADDTEKLKPWGDLGQSAQASGMATPRRGA
jgi:hypothetical protein